MQAEVLQEVQGPQSSPEPSQRQTMNGTLTKCSIVINVKL
jgi:hypothetical protein